MLKRIALALALLASGSACPASKKSDTTPPADSGGTATTPDTGAPPADPPADPADSAPADKPADPTAGGLPDKAGMPCDDKGCGGGYTCVRYYGIAGPKGPEFRSCEIPCQTADAKCPAGTACTTIADGPGRVCR